MRFHPRKLSTIAARLGAAGLLAVALVGCAADPDPAGNTVAPTAAATTEAAATGTETAPRVSESDDAGPSESVPSALDSAAEPVDSDTLDGRTFTIDDGPGAGLTLVFADGAVSISGGCNGLGGEVVYASADGNLLSVPVLLGTAMACEQDLMDKDSVITEFLKDPVTWADNGDTVTLVGPEGQLTLTEIESEDSGDLDLVGPTWYLNTLIDGDVATKVPAEVQATLQVAADGTVNVYDGCNGGSGPSTVDGDELLIVEQSQTLRACGDVVDATAAHLRSVLQGDDPATFTVVGDQLTVTRGDLGVEFGVMLP